VRTAYPAGRGRHTHRPRPPDRHDDEEDSIVTRPTALGAADLAAVEAILADDDRDRLRRYPGDPGTRQPVHTVYVPADRVHAGLVEQWGGAALAALDRDAGTPEQLAAATGTDPSAVADVWEAVRAKLGSEPVEDLRVDLEDGYGDRGDDAEDEAAGSAAAALVKATAEGTCPPYVGLRFKSLEGETRQRGIRSLDLVLGGLLDGGDLPAGWVVTLPKVTSVRQVSAMVELCRRLEAAYGLAERRLRFEIQVETSQAILGADGEAAVAAMVHAGDQRCTALHFGTYDYTAALGIAGGFQAMDHPAADHAKAVMQLAAAGTGVRLSDGSTNILPVGETDRVHAAWRLHTRLVTRSLERGFYQGWDLHPAQLPTRYLATYLFFRRDYDALTGRMHAYLAGSDAGVLDEPATAQAMAGFLVRGVHCGALDPTDMAARCGTEVADVERLAARRVG
jgi:citrate lyase beta subunit